MTIESPIATRLASLHRELAAVDPVMIPQAIADAAAELLDAATLVLAANGTTVEPLAAASDRPTAAAYLENTRRLTLPSLGTLGRVLATGQSFLVSGLAPSDLDAEPPDFAELLLEFGATSIVLVALGWPPEGVKELDTQVNPKPAGALALFRLEDQPGFDEVDVAIAEDLARAASASFHATASARHHAVRRGHAQNVYVADLLDALPLEAAVISQTGQLRATNRRWDEYATAAEFDGAGSTVGTPYLEMLVEAAVRHRSAGHLHAGISDVLAGNLPSFSTDYDSAGGNISRSYSLTVMPLGKARDGALITRTDVTMRKALERQLAQRATHDSLTGLPNRMLLQERLSHAVVRASRSGSLVAVLFCDLDQFKFVNDTLGHDVGDKVLIAVADRLRHACRATDSITRFGGDEFVVVAEDLTDLAGANAVAATLLDSLRNPFTIDEHELYFGVSIGVALAEGSSSMGQNAAAILLREADTAMYEAKRAGRNRVVVFRAELHEAAERALRLSTSLRAAMSQDQLTLEFQPQFDCSTGALLAAEAILRWNHPDLGRLPADEFLVEAEESGAIIELGLWTITAACAQAAVWASAAPPGFSIGVNLTLRQLTHPDLVDHIQAAVADNVIDARCLTLEISESALADDPHRMANTLGRLHATGVRLAIDNFGTGYSSLSYLQAFPVDELKVDRTFVVVLGENPRASAMVSGISGLAKALGFRLVADGVGNATQLKAVQAAGCDSYQGTAEPESAETFGVRLGRTPQSV
jgi:diguanylate cyclase (GGDEF)-like protein